MMEQMLQNVYPAENARGRPRAFNHDDVVLSAARLFWRHGYSGTSTRSLTAATGLSPSSLYAAFGSKAGLFEVTVRTYAERYHAIYKEAVAQEDIQDVIESLLRNSVYEFTQGDETHPGCIISSAVMNDSTETLNTRKYISELQEADIGSLLTRIRRAQKEGQLGSEVNAVAFSDLVQCIWQGLSAMANRGSTRKTLLGTARMAQKLMWQQIVPLQSK